MPAVGKPVEGVGEILIRARALPDLGSSQRGDAPARRVVSFIDPENSFAIGRDLRHIGAVGEKVGSGIASLIAEVRNGSPVPVVCIYYIPLFFIVGKEFVILNP